MVSMGQYPSARPTRVYVRGFWVGQPRTRSGTGAVSGTGLPGLLVTAVAGPCPSPRAGADPERSAHDARSSARPGPRCAQRGTKKDDVICGLGGDDQVTGGLPTTCCGAAAATTSIQGRSRRRCPPRWPGPTTTSMPTTSRPTAIGLRCGRGRTRRSPTSATSSSRDCEKVDQDNDRAHRRDAGTGHGAGEPACRHVVGTLTATDLTLRDEHTFALVAGTGSTTTAPSPSPARRCARPAPSTSRPRPPVRAGPVRRTPWGCRSKRHCGRR